MQPRIELLAESCFDCHYGNGQFLTRGYKSKGIWSMKQGNNTLLSVSWCDSQPGWADEDVKHKQFGGMNRKLVFIRSSHISLAEYSWNITT